MNHPFIKNSWRNLSKKLTLVLLLSICGALAFATLGDGRIAAGKPKSALLSDKSGISKGSFSLKSGYIFRGNQVINIQHPRYFNLNTTIFYQQGHTTYIVPLHKKVLMDK